MLTETTALTATDMTRDIHLCRWLCEWEVTWTETDLCIRTEHLLCEGKHYLLEVGERYVLVDIKTLNLVEEAMCAGSDCLVAVNATRADDADRRLVAFHRANLYRAGVAAQHDIAGDVLLVLLDEEGVLHVAGRVVGSEVQRTEYVPVVLNLGTIGDGKAQA